MSCEIGVVIPVHNAQYSIALVTESLLENFSQRGLSCCIVLVDDKSTDQSAIVIDNLAREHWQITAIHLSRNFGQQCALLCGLNHTCHCRYVLTIDDDLQHRAPIALALYDKIREGYDLVYAIPLAEKRPLLRQFGSTLRDAFFSLVIGTPRDIKVSSFRIMTGALATKIAAERQPYVYLSASAFRYAPYTANIPYRQPMRAYGQSCYTLSKLARTYLNLIRHYTCWGRLFPARSCGAPYEIQDIERG